MHTGGKVGEEIHSVPGEVKGPKDGPWRRDSDDQRG